MSDTVGDREPDGLDVTELDKHVVTVGDRDETHVSVMEDEILAKYDGLDDGDVTDEKDVVPHADTDSDGRSVEEDERDDDTVIVTDVDTVGDTVDDDEAEMVRVADDDRQDDTVGEIETVCVRESVAVTHAEVDAVAVCDGGAE